MKKLLSILVALAVVTSLSATNLAGKRIYVNPGHGSFGPNDRPMATIPYPNLSSTGMPDTCGFYETNTNLWKCLYLRDRLVEAGATVEMSRTQNGPWPYEKVNGQYPDYSWDNYQNLPNYTAYNKNLSVICEEVESGNYDLFISVHSNAASDGSTANYPLCLYRGHDESKGGTSAFEVTCRNIWNAIWPWRQEMFASGLEYESSYTTTTNIRGDIDFYGSSSTRHSASSGQDYTGYLGVLKHGCVGGLVEGYFHTYQPARHRALNPDYCRMEGYAYYRGIVDYFNADQDTKGYILGVIKDEHERISHPLYNYAPKMHDQWLPLNGAVVTLYKGGVKVADYNVDTCYNGIFYFGNLVPGNDYTLDATCEGYKPMWDEYKAPLTVTANHVTYPRIYLENENWEEPAVTYTDYPEPEIPASVGLAGSYAMTQTYIEQTIDELRGKTIHRVLMQDDTTMYVLAFDAAENASLYLVNPTTHVIKHEIPTTGMQGSLRAVGDIALTADHVLLACNYSENQYDDSQVAGGNTQVRGVFRVYKWADLTAAPTELFTSMYSANWYRGNIGNSMSVSGASDDFTMAVTCPTISSSGVLRLVNYQVTNGQLASTSRNQDPNGTPALSLPVYGWDLQIKPSPLHDGSFVLIGSELGAVEITFKADAAAPDYLGRTPFVADGATFFRYAKHVLMVVPEVAGVKLYDVTDGLDTPTLIATTNTEITTPTAATYMLAAGTVKNADITLYLCKDSLISKFTTAGVEQPVIPHINAYGLNVTLDSVAQTYTFTYTANSDAVATNIVFYQEGEQVGKVAVDPAKAGVNNAVVATSDLPGDEGDEFTWAVELVGEIVGNWGEIHAATKAALNMSRVFNTIDNNPENATFQRIYLADYVRNSANSGLYIINPDYTRGNTSPMLGGNALFGCLYRLSIDAEGYVYMSDWTDGNSGVYIANPNDFTTFPNMFQGTRDADGVISNGSVNVGSSTPGVHVYGKGADTKLIVYNEDPGSTLVANGLCIYNIGQADSSIVRTWSTAPSKVMSIPGQANTEGNVWGCSRGIWVSQNRTNGNNNTSATSLQFFTWEGTRKFSSASDDYKDIIIGSEGSAFALSADEKMLVLNNGDQEFMLFDIVWADDNTPTLTLRHAYKHNHGVNNNNAFRQLNFDYAGNLIATGDPGMYVYTIPTAENVTVVPAKSTLKVVKAADPETAINEIADEHVTYSNHTIWNTDNVQLMVFSASGQMVAAGNSDISLEAMPTGVYVVRMPSGKVLKVLR